MKTSDIAQPQTAQIRMRQPAITLRAVCTASAVRRPVDCDPPQELDWDFNIGPSPMRPYNPYYDAFDWFKDLGGGF
jgi:hypothetical protein